MTTAPVRRERIAALDVLRALALFGMILVHFNDRAQGSGGLKATIDFFISGKSAAIFAILFGASFAVFLRSADARGEPVTARFLRRMAGLFAFGFIAEGVFGYNVLIGYAVWGCALLVLRHWSTPALIALAILCHLLSTPVFNVGVGGYQWAIGGPEFANEVQRSRVVAAREANTRLEAAAASEDFGTVVAARVRHMVWFYQQPHAFLPHRLVTFLIGLLALRVGVWEQPFRHKKLLIGAMVAGLAAAVVNTWMLPLQWPSMQVGRVQGALRGGLGLVPGWWLAFTYVSVVLLVVGSSSQRLRLIRPAGQMALTNYLMQVSAIDVLTRPYGFGADLTPLAALASSLALFAVQVFISSVWLRSFRYGPAEWLLRCTTNARLEANRRDRMDTLAVTAST